jgi:peptide/nickel transport system substrate-binding protein
VPATQLLTPSTVGYDDTLKTMYATNLDKAKQLLDQAGWKTGSDGVREKDGKKLELQLINIAAFGFDQMAQLLQAQVKKAGFDVKISAESFPTVAATMNAGKQNLGDFFYFDLDARDALYATLDSSQIKSGYNWAHYSNSKLDALLAKANSDSSGREQAIKDAQKIAMDDAVFIPLYDLRQLWVTSKNVSGVKFNTSGYPLFYTTK